MTPSRALPLLVAVAAFTASACTTAKAPNPVVVQANEYAFTAPDSLPAGATAFGLANGGFKYRLAKRGHEL